MYNSDKPIKKETEDLLNRKELAKAIGNSIMDNVIIKEENKETSTESLVFGIYGSWGDGKSSLANMIQEVLQPIDKNIIVRFNPWLFSNIDSVMTQLFKSISESIKNKTENTNSIVELSTELIDKINKLSDISFFGKIKEGLEKSIPGIKVLESVIEVYSNFIDNTEKTDDKPLNELKDIINDIIIENKCRIIIFIDDFDRLSEEEIRIMFQAVNVLGDFKNTAYVLLMDKDVVVKSLEKVQGGNGDAYLRKIVQIPIDLPSIQQEQLKEIVVNKFNYIYKFENEYKLKNDEFLELINDIAEYCIAPFINNIRDINRIFNLFDFKKTIIGEFVNPADLLALCAIELYGPYREKNKNGTVINVPLYSEIKNGKFLNYNEIPDKTSPEYILFRKTEYEHLYFGRLRDEDYFDYFFSFQKPTDIFSLPEIYHKVYLEKINDLSNLYLLKETQEKKLNNILKHFHVASAKGLNEERYQVIYTALFKILKEINKLEEYKKSEEYKIISKTLWNCCLHIDEKSQNEFISMLDIAEINKYKKIYLKTITDNYLVKYDEIGILINLYEPEENVYESFTIKNDIKYIFNYNNLTSENKSIINLLIKMIKKAPVDICQQEIEMLEKEVLIKIWKYHDFGGYIDFINNNINNNDIIDIISRSVGEDDCGNYTIKYNPENSNVRINENTLKIIEDKIKEYHDSKKDVIRLEAFYQLAKQDFKGSVNCKDF